MGESRVLNVPISWSKSESLADDGFIDMPFAGTNGGFGFTQLGDAEQWAWFSFTSAGVVSLPANSASVVNTDADTNFCIFGSGGVPRFKNRRGAAKNLLVVAWLS